MSAFAELGLREDADEPDIKRAYARRLRVTRPDEDAEGFQALNAAYKAALAAARWRAQAAADGEDEALTLEPEQAAARLEAAQADRPETSRPKAEAEPPAVPDPSPGPAQPLGHLFPEHVIDAAPVLDGPETLFDYASAADNGAISFDFDAFSTDLFATTADPQADLRAWLEARMASWPLAMKPTLAPYLLQALDDEDVAVSPEHFAIIIAAFGLDDVLSHIDPLAVAQLRAANERRWARREAVTRARRLLAPGNRRTLDKTVRIGGYAPFVAPMLARLVTGPGASYRTGLRWVPLVARWVMNLLRYLSAGAVDALTPPIEPKVLARWQLAERTVGWIGFMHLVLAVMAISALVGFYGAYTEDARPEQRAGDRVSAIWHEEGPTPQKAVDDYTDFIAAYPPPRSDDIADDVATAMFNRGIVLGKMGKMDEAVRSYQALDETFGDSQVTSIRHLVASGLNNWAFILGHRKEYAAELPVVRKVVARYPRAGDEERGNDSFDVQVAKALINEADALEHLGDREATLAACRDLLARFPDPQTDQMKDLRSTALDIMHDYDGVGTIGPGPAPVLKGGQPAAGAWTPNWTPGIGQPKQ